MTNVVRTIVDDPRVGRLLFSSHLGNPVVVRKRTESGALMAMLSGEQVLNALGVPENEQIKATAHFVVGGVVQTISTWLAGGVQLDPDQLVDQLTAILDVFVNPDLFNS
jgi:hypothetical protein